MVFNTYDGIKISAIAASVPAQVLNIESMQNDPNEDSSFIRQFIKNTGIHAKRICPFSQTASDHSYTAAKQIMDAGYYTPEEIGILINITQTPDYRTPSTAMVIQKRLGLSKNCMVFDVNLGCSGFVYGVSLVAGLLKSSSSSKGLVTIGDTLARGRVDNNGRRVSNTKLLFGDASAAILLEKSDSDSFSSGLMSDGEGHKALTWPHNAWKHPIGPECIPNDDIAVFNFTIHEVPALLNDYMATTNTQIEDYDNLVLHQANMMIVKNIAKRVGMPIERVPICLDRFGNTSGASVPLAIVDKHGDNAEDSEIRLLTSSFGVGLSWGVVGFTINTKDILPLQEGLDTYDDGISDSFDDYDK